MPFTDSQRRFVLVAEGKEDPFSLEEVAWWKYMDQMAYEARSRNGETIQYHVQNDTLYNRDMAKSLKSTMFKVMRDNHRK